MGKAAVKGMHQTSGTTSQAGFTLLELIVGLTVGAILLTAIYTTFVGVSQTQRRVERVLNNTSTWRFVTETLRQDLSRLSSSSTFEGSASGFTTEMFEGAGEVPVVLTYVWSRALLTRTTREGTLAVELPDGYQQPAFRYRSENEWTDAVTQLPYGLELRIATPLGQVSRTFTLEFEPRMQGASEEG